MKIRYILFILLSAFLFSTNSQGQILSKITKSIDKAVDGAIDSAVESTVGNATEKIAEKMLEKIIEKIFSGESVSQDSFPGSMGSSSSDSTSSTISNIDIASIFGGGDIDKTKVFDFTHKMKMEITSDGEEAQVFDYYFHESNTYIGMEIQSMFVILDLETQDTYTIMNDKLMKMNMKSLVEKMSPEGMPDDGYTKVTKTGKKEMIVGHMCEEYIAETEEGVANIWITEEFVNQNLEKTSFIQNVRDKDESYNVNGMFFRYKYVETGKEEEAVTMNVIEFNPSVKTINFKDY